MAAYIPFGILSQWALDNASFKGALIFGAWLNMIGSWLRYFSAFIDVNMYRIYSLVLLFGGQILAACAQPFLLNSPPKVASLWFTPEGRATADMVGTIGNILGVGMGQVLSPILANVPSNDTMTAPLDVIYPNGTTNSTQPLFPLTPVPNFQFMLMIFSIISSVAAFFATFFSKERPDTPPCRSSSQPSDPFVVGLKKVYKNKPYMVVLCTFSIGLGVFNTLTTLLGQIVKPLGYGPEDAGFLGLIVVGTGLVVAGVTGPVLDCFHKYKEIYVVAFIISTLSFVSFGAVVEFLPHTFIILSCIMAFMGAAAFMILPTALELSVETTYPVAPVTSAGFLWLMGQVTGIISLFACNALIDPVTGDTSKAVWFLVSLVIFGTLLSLTLIYPLSVKYRRLDAESKNDVEGDKLIN
eukprot:TRINITY_DN1386_c2_g1_i2.p1 TRINITY_DN1386_c2_g1~~TRINITY_DN1386_c2_g1_i2.p1  ORF type:complete len:411 (-),score=62.86 TRINITY_DN1386_c2_g1_i2:45-1277(-)